MIADRDARRSWPGSCPAFEGEGSLVLAVAILGATVMPHAIYLHSALVSADHRGRTAAQRPALLRTQRVEVTPPWAWPGW